MCFCYQTVCAIPNITLYVFNNSVGTLRTCTSLPPVMGCVHAFSQLPLSITEYVPEWACAMLCPCLKPEQNEEASILLESGQAVQPNLREGGGDVYGWG